MRYLVSRRMRTNLAHVSPICICMNRRGLRDWNKFGRLSELCNLYRLTNDGRVHSILGLRYVRKIATFALFSIIQVLKKVKTIIDLRSIFNYISSKHGSEQQGSNFRTIVSNKNCSWKIEKISRPTISRRFPFGLSHTLAPYRVQRELLIRGHRFGFWIRPGATTIHRGWTRTYYDLSFCAFARS